jgi:hypothetical protein
VERGATKSKTLRVDVQWADITRAEGDAFVVGHYVGVLPQYAEWALDCALSGTKEHSRLLLTELTRRGAIRGALGDVMFFPWTEGRHIVLAGMGRTGTFGDAQLRTLARTVLETIGRLLKQPTVCTVLIGSGFGNLTVEQSVSGMLDGIEDAFTADPSLDIGCVRIVERRLDKSYEILECVRKVAQSRKLDIDVAKDVVERDEAGGVIPIPFGFSLMLASLAQACREGSGSRLHTTLEALVGELPATLRQDVRAELRKLGDERNARRLGLSFRLGQVESAPAAEIADRVSFSQDGTRVRTAAITNMATVAERSLNIPVAWVDRIVEDLHASLPDGLEERAVKAHNYLVHQDLKGQLQGRDGPLVLEVDRTMARVPWEMIQDDAAEGVPLGVRRPVARQLRTSYSPRVGGDSTRTGLRVLVIGNPESNLDYAEREARQVARLFRDHKIDVDARIGAPDELGLGRRPGDEPADLFEIVGLLQSGNYDVVHYSGHAVFDPGYPDRSGWRFAGGEILTASKLENVDRPPRLIVANACISAGLSTMGAEVAEEQADPDAAEATADSRGRSRKTGPPGDARLVASLADEFFRRGVADYIGTAWEVPEGPAEMFAVTFYETLLGNGAGGKTATLGKAVQEARKALWTNRRKWRAELQTVWAAYQHYGDPMQPLRE